MTTETLPTKRYLETDAELAERSLRLARERIEKGLTVDDYFANLEKSAENKSARIQHRITAKLKRLQDEYSSTLKDSGKENTLAALIQKEEEQKRRRSKAGLAGYLVSKNFITPEHVTPYSGEINMEELKKSEYFTTGPGAKYLPALEGYRFGKYSKINKAAQNEFTESWFKEEIPIYERDPKTNEIVKIDSFCANSMINAFFAVGSSQESTRPPSIHVQKHEEIVIPETDPIVVKAPVTWDYLKGFDDTGQKEQKRLSVQITNGFTRFMQKANIMLGIKSQSPTEP